MEGVTREREISWYMCCGSWCTSLTAWQAPHQPSTRQTRERLIYPGIVYATPYISKENTTTSIYKQTTLAVMAQS